MQVTMLFYINIQLFIHTYFTGSNVTMYPLKNDLDIFIFQSDMSNDVATLCIDATDWSRASLPWY